MRVKSTLTKRSPRPALTEETYGDEEPGVKVHNFEPQFPPPARPNQHGHIHLKDYNYHYTILQRIIDDSAIPVTDPKYVFLAEMVQSMNMNPTMTDAQKNEALTIAIDFFSGIKKELRVKALQNTPQDKTQRTIVVWACKIV